VFAAYDVEVVSGFGVGTEYLYYFADWPMGAEGVAFDFDVY
jgi:hypothetical protein